MSFPLSIVIWDYDPNALRKSTATFTWPCVS